MIFKVNAKFLLWLEKGWQWRSSSVASSACFKCKRRSNSVASSACFKCKRRSNSVASSACFKCKRRSTARSSSVASSACFKCKRRSSSVASSACFKRKRGSSSVASSACFKCKRRPTARSSSVASSACFKCKRRSSSVASSACFKRKRGSSSVASSACFKCKRRPTARSSSVASSACFKCKRRSSSVASDWFVIIPPPQKKTPTQNPKPKKMPKRTYGFPSASSNMLKPKFSQLPPCHNVTIPVQTQCHSLQAKACCGIVSQLNATRQLLCFMLPVLPIASNCYKYLPVQQPLQPWGWQIEHRSAHRVCGLTSEVETLRSVWWKGSAEATATSFDPWVSQHWALKAFQNNLFGFVEVCNIKIY